MDGRRNPTLLLVAGAAMVATVFFMLLGMATKGMLPEPGETIMLVIIGGGILLLAAWLSMR